MTPLLALGLLVSVQSPSDAELRALLVGHWSGALIRESSIQTVELELLPPADGSLAARIDLPDWLWWPAPDSTATVVDGRIQLELVYGPAELRLDVERNELRGKLVAADGELFVHLKRALAPARLRVEARELSVESRGVTIAGTLYTPPWPGPHPAVVQVWSRGPHERWEGDAGLGRMFAERGIAFATYDKRGCGASGGDLRAARFDDLVSDLEAIVAAVAADPRVDADQIGFHAESAGGWVAARVAARAATPPAFLAFVLAPATSVLEQQREAVDGWMVRNGFGTPEREAARRYVDLLAAGDTWTELEVLRARARSEGWQGLLEGDPASAEELAVAWVRRHDYDPTAAWRALDVPVLAHFGERDWIVPHESNAEALRAAELTDLTVVVLPDVDHGMIEWPSGPRIPRSPELEPYYVFNKLFAGLWARELEWIVERVRRSPHAPLER